MSVLDGIADQSPGATFAQGCTLSNDEPPAYDPAHMAAFAGEAAALARIDALSPEDRAVVRRAARTSRSQSAPCATVKSTSTASLS